MIEIFYLDGEIKSTSIETISEIEGKKTWIDCTDITKSEATILKEKFNIHPLTAEDLVNSHVRLKVEEFPNYLFCVLYTLRKRKKINLQEMDFVLFKDVLISNHKRDIPSFQSLKSDQQRMSSLLSKGPDFFFHRLVDKEIDEHLVLLDGVDEEISSIEDDALNSPSKETVAKILSMKKLLGEIKKMTHSQREQISKLVREDFALISKKLKPYLRDIHDHAIRVSDAVESSRENVITAYELYTSTVSNSMNQVMKVLTVISTIFIPLSFLAGVYGMNFVYIPELAYSWGYPLFWVVMLILAGSMLWYFKRKNWF